MARSNRSTLEIPGYPPEVRVVDRLGPDGRSGGNPTWPHKASVADGLNRGQVLGAIAGDEVQGSR